MKIGDLHSIRFRLEDIEKFNLPIKAVMINIRHANSASIIWEISQVLDSAFLTCHCYTPTYNKMSRMNIISWTEATEKIGMIEQYQGL